MRTALLLFVTALACFAQRVIISAAAFTGAGLNDATSGGLYTPAPANAAYVVTISATGTPDHFKWTKNGGALSAAVAITGAAQTLTDGVTITFAATTGHTTADLWTITATASGSISASSFAQTGVGAAISRNAQDKMREVVSVTDFTGTDSTGVAFSDTGFASALGSPAAVVMVPKGTYKFATTVTMSHPHQRLLCDNPYDTILSFTGASQGIDIYAGATGTLIGNEVSNCQITTTNAAGNSALIVDSNAHPSAGIVLKNNFITTTPPNGGGAWINGLRFLGNQGAIVEGNRVYGSIANAAVVGDGSTAVDSIKFAGNTFGAINLTGTFMALASAQHITSVGDYFQGGGTAYITVDAASDLTIMGDTCDSGGNATTDCLVSSGVLAVNGMTLVGSGYTRGIRISNGRAALADVYSNGSFSSYAVGMRTASPGSVLRDCDLLNTHATGVGVEVDFGTASAVTGCYVSTVGGAVINLAGGGTNLNFSGNQLVSSTGYGVLLPADGSTYTFTDSDTRYGVSDAAHICGNCDGGSGAAIPPPNVGSLGRSLNGVPIPDAVYVGADVASAGTIVPTAAMFHVTGTSSTSVMTPPFAGFAGCVDIIADAAWPWATGGGAGGFNSAGTAIAGQAQRFCYDGDYARRLWYTYEPPVGISATKTVRNAAGTGTCTLIFTAGLLTGGSC